MENLLTVARQVAILFVLVGVGAFLRRLKLLSTSAVEGIVNILILVVTPCLVIDVFQRHFDPGMMRNLLLAFAFAVVGHLLVIALSSLVIRHPDEDIRRPLRLAAVFSNAGFMGLPLEQSLLGDEGVFFGAVYVVVFNLFIWSWGLFTMSAGRDGARHPSASRKLWFNPGTVSLAVGLPLFLFSARLPDVLGVPVHQLANLNTPVAMLVIGYYLAGLKFGRIVRIGGVYASATIRLTVYPLIMIALLYPFRAALDRNMMLALVIAASAPVAAMVSMFAAKYKRNVDVSVALISATTLLSILTMPPVIALAMSLF